MTAPCPKCGRFTKPLPPVSNGGTGYAHAYVAQGECSRCGPVCVDWDLQYGDWDPES